MTPDELAIARRTRAKRWVNAPTIHGYPALADADETEATLAANPPERGDRRPKPAKEE